jgi:hypothetical protein
MSQCNQYVAGADRWSAERQCSKEEKFDTGYCTVHLKMLYKDQFQTMGGVILQEGGYDPRFTDAINFPIIRDYIDANFAPCFRQRLLNESIGLAQMVSSAGADAPANWAWWLEQPRFYSTISDVNDKTLEWALGYEVVATQRAMNNNQLYADYDAQIENYGLDTMPESDYDELMAEYQEYRREKRAYDGDVQEILGEFREEQTKFITDLRERQRIELAGLIVPISPLD